MSEEWERLVKHLLEVSIPRRCPEHVDVLRRFHSFLVSRGLRPASRYRRVQAMARFFEAMRVRAEDVD
mgnify:CR=1 FL=1